MPEKTIDEIEQSSFVPSADRKALLIKGWENTIEQFLEDGILDTTEEKRLVAEIRHVMEKGNSYPFLVFCFFRIIIRIAFLGGLEKAPTFFINPPFADNSPH